MWGVNCKTYHAEGKRTEESTCCSTTFLQVHKWSEAVKVVHLFCCLSKMDCIEAVFQPRYTSRNVFLHAGQPAKKKMSTDLFTIGLQNFVNLLWLEICPPNAFKTFNTTIWNSCDICSGLAQKMRHQTCSLIISQANAEEAGAIICIHNWQYKGSKDECVKMSFVKFSCCQRHEGHRPLALDVGKDIQSWESSTAILKLGSGR